MPPPNSGRNLVCSKLKQRAHTLRRLILQSWRMQGVSQLCRVSPIIHVAANDRFSTFQSFTIFLVFGRITDRLSGEEKMPEKNWWCNYWHKNWPSDRVTAVPARVGRLHEAVGWARAHLHVRQQRQRETQRQQQRPPHHLWVECHLFINIITQPNWSWMDLTAKQTFFHPCGHCLKVDHGEHPSPLSGCTFCWNHH